MIDRLPLLYRGIGAARPSPDAPGIDALLSTCMRQAGFKGSRTPGECIWASTSFDQAFEYATEDNPDHLLSVEPLEGAVVGWAVGCADMVVAFESWLWRREFDLRDAPRSCRAFLSDVAGDAGIFEQYLRLKRQRRSTQWLASAWLAGLEIVEVEVGASCDLQDRLAEHRGEVWISGPCRLEPLPHGFGVDTSSRMRANDPSALVTTFSH